MVALAIITIIVCGLTVLTLGVSVLAAAIDKNRVSDSILVAALPLGIVALILGMAESIVALATR